MRPSAFLRYRQERSSGFTLIEMMVVVSIMAILAAVALPSFTDLIAEQKVRSMASDIVGDLATARMEAIKQQRRVVMERAGAPAAEVPGVSTWREGWRICVDLNKNNKCDPNEAVLKTFGGYGVKTSITNKVCATDANFKDSIAFGGDGTVGNAVDGDALTISDGTRHIRGIRISAVGRASVDVFAQGEGSVCP